MAAGQHRGLDGPGRLRHDRARRTLCRQRVAPVRRQPHRQPGAARQPAVDPARAALALPPQSARMAQMGRERGRRHPAHLGRDLAGKSPAGPARRHRHRCDPAGFRNQTQGLRRRPRGRAGGRMGIDAQAGQWRHLGAEHARRGERGKQLPRRAQRRDLALAHQLQDESRGPAPAAGHRDQRSRPQPGGRSRAFEGGCAARSDGRAGRREVPPCRARLQPELAARQSGALLLDDPAIVSF